MFAAFCNGLLLQNQSNPHLIACPRLVKPDQHTKIMCLYMCLYIKARFGSRGAYKVGRRRARRGDQLYSPNLKRACTLPLPPRPTLHPKCFWAMTVHVGGWFTSWRPRHTSRQDYAYGLQHKGVATLSHIAPARAAPPPLARGVVSGWVQEERGWTRGGGIGTSQGWR